MAEWLRELTDRFPFERRRARLTAARGWALALLGAAMGAGLMYLLDPALGTRRRALGRDRVVSLARRSGEAADSASREALDRARGLLIELRSRWRGRLRGGVRSGSAVRSRSGGARAS
jgi:hypothetical protein